MQAAGRVDEERPHAARLRGRQRVEEHGRRIRALRGGAPSEDPRRSAHVCSCSIAPGAERVGGGEQNRAAARLLARGDLGRRRRLARPVDADEEHDAQRNLRGRRRTRGRREEPFDLFEQDPAQGREVLALRAARPCAHGVGQRGRRLRSHVRRDERLLERFEHRLVEAQALLDRGPELVEDLGVGHEEPALDLREEAAARARRVGGVVSGVVGHGGRGKISQTGFRRPDARSGIGALTGPPGPCSPEAAAPWRPCRPRDPGPRHAGDSACRDPACGARRAPCRVGDSPPRSGGRVSRR